MVPDDIYVPLKIQVASSKLKFCKCQDSVPDIVKEGQIQALNKLY